MRRIQGMPARFVNIDHDTPLLLPPDLRDWVAPDHMVHFIMDAVKALDLSCARTNHRGTGHAQYPPFMMLGLLIYCYATGTFASRRIETLTYENVAVRFLTGDTHPDHDSICKFRRENKDLLSAAFHQVLELAARAKVLQVGDITVAIDGTKILANASKHSAVSYGHAVEQMKLAGEQITQLLQKAEDADSTPLQDGLTIPEEIKRREDRIAKLREATQAMEARAKERLIEEQATYQEKLAARQAKALVDSGYYSETAVQTVETGEQSPTVYAAMKRQSHGRSIAQLEVRDDPPPPPPDAPVAERMAHRLDTAAGKQLYGLRKETVEPVFGIIKQAIGFRSFLLRGKEKASLEWTLVTTSYNLKRLFNLGMSLQTA